MKSCYISRNFIKYFVFGFKKSYASYIHIKKKNSASWQFKLNNDEFLHLTSLTRLVHLNGTTSKRDKIYYIFKSRFKTIKNYFLKIFEWKNKTSTLKLTYIILCTYTRIYYIYMYAIIVYVLKLEKKCLTLKTNTGISGKIENKLSVRLLRAVFFSEFFHFTYFQS